VDGAGGRGIRKEAGVGGGIKGGRRAWSRRERHKKRGRVGGGIKGGRRARSRRERHKKRGRVGGGSREGDAHGAGGRGIRKEAGLVGDQGRATRTEPKGEA
jgi:hypothetical protein